MSLIQFDFGLSKDYEPWINDVLKVIVSGLVVHVLTTYNNNNLTNLFNMEWIQSVLFAVLGFTVYHLIAKKLIKFSFEDGVKEGFYNIRL